MQLFGIVAKAADGAGDAAATGGIFSAQNLMGILPIVVMIAIFYFAMIRPENKKKKKVQEMRSSLEVGNEITTVGGLVGKIVSIKDDYITFETGEDRVRIQVTRWAVSGTGREAEQQ
jgi:preprotein translocase subunit YajC